jgi:hypothetical protein
VTIGIREGNVFRFDSTVTVVSIAGHANIVVEQWLDSHPPKFFDS